MIAIVLAMIAAALTATYFIRQPTGYMKLPFLVSAVYLTWIGPQMFSLNSDVFLPQGGLTSLNWMILLCFIATLIGWRLAVRNFQPVRYQRQRHDAYAGDFLQRLLIPVSVMTAVFFVLRLNISVLALDENLTAQWSGPIVILATIFKLRVVPLYLSIWMFFKRRTPWTTTLVVCNLLLCGSVAFSQVGRTEILDIGIITILAMWFSARKKFPLPMLVAGGMAMIVVVFAVGQLRSTIKYYNDTLGQDVTILNPIVWERIDVRSSVTDGAANAPDLTNATYMIEYLNQSGRHTMGSQLWDDAVFRYIPAQIVGSDLKKSLLINDNLNEIFANIEIELGYTKNIGTTKTGFGSAYEEAGYFGSLIFVMLGYLSGFFWTRAAHGSIWFQIMYATTVVKALTSFTHTCYWMMLGLPWLIALLLILRFAVSATRPRSASRPLSARYRPKFNLSERR